MRESRATGLAGSRRHRPAAGSRPPSSLSRLDRSALLRSAYTYREGGSAWDAFPEEWRQAGRENARTALADFRNSIGTYPSPTDLATVKVPVLAELALGALRAEHGKVVVDVEVGDANWITSLFRDWSWDDILGDHLFQERAPGLR
jgi:hypothetical protein